MITEIVVYRVTPGLESTFDQLHDELKTTFASWAGFVGFRTLVSCQDPLQRIDEVTWCDEESSQAAYAKFKTLPSFSAFMVTIEMVSHSGHYRSL